MLYCPYCGQQRLESWSYCQYCGRPQPTLDPTSAGDESPSPHASAAVQTLSPRTIHLLDQGDLAGAEKELKRALALEPEQAAIHAYLGCLCLRSYRLDEALSYLERAVALGPDSYLPQLFLGEYWYRLGFYNKAIAFLEKAAALCPGRNADAPRVQAFLNRVRREGRHSFERTPPDFPNLKPALGRLFRRHRKAVG